MSSELVACDVVEMAFSCYPCMSIEIARFFWGIAPRIARR